MFFWSFFVWSKKFQLSYGSVEWLIDHWSFAYFRLMSVVFGFTWNSFCVPKKYLAHKSNFISHFWKIMIVIFCQIFSIIFYLYINYVHVLTFTKWSSSIVSAHIFLDYEKLFIIKLQRNLRCERKINTCHQSSFHNDLKRNILDIFDWVEFFLT